MVQNLPFLTNFRPILNDCYNYKRFMGFILSMGNYEDHLPHISTMWGSLEVIWGHCLFCKWCYLNPFGTLFPKILQKSLIISEKSWSTRYLLIHPDLFVLNLFIWNHSNHSIPKLRIPWSFWDENGIFFHSIDFIISYISNKSYKMYRAYGP